MPILNPVTINQMLNIFLGPLDPYCLNPSEYKEVSTLIYILFKQ